MAIGNGEVKSRVTGKRADTKLRTFASFTTFSQRREVAQRWLVCLAGLLHEALMTQTRSKCRFPQSDGLESDDTFTSPSPSGFARVRVRFPTRESESESLQNGLESDSSPDSDP